MDAKSLEVLRQLKQSMNAAKDEEQLKVRPKQGFSEESEEAFRQLARRRLESPTIAAQPAVQRQAEAPRHEASTSRKEPARWESRTCRFCKSKFNVNLLWDRIPIMCSGCRTERKTHYEVPEGDTLYTETKVFHGGGPGTGRRK